MIDTPLIVQTERRPTAVIHLTMPVADMPKLFGAAVSELLAELNAQGVAPAGPLVAYHFNLNGPGFQMFDFEVGLPVDALVRANGRVKPSELPGLRAIRTTYHGGYEGLPGAWEEFQTWIKSSGHAQAPSLFESYMIGPANSPDPSAWQTELTRFLA